VDVLERGQQDDAGEVQVEDGCVLQSRSFSDETALMPIEDIETAAGPVSPILKQRIRQEPKRIWDGAD
jgi:hypothetical protein